MAEFFEQLKGSFETQVKVNEALMERLKEAEAGRTVKVGVFGSSASKMHEYNGKPNKISVLQIAQIHEFGAPSVNIPERSFLRSTGRLYKATIIEEQKKLLEAFLRGTLPLKKALGILGESIVSKVKRRIRDGIEPALRPATIARKGSSTPLVDTGQLINSIGYEVSE